MASDQAKNEGEGNRTAAREFNKRQGEFARSGKVERQAEEAKRATEGQEKAELERAEDKGKSRAAGEDPEVRRRY